MLQRLHGDLPLTPSFARRENRFPEAPTPARHSPLLAKEGARGRSKQIFFAAALLLYASAARAYSTGIASSSFPVPELACNFCHSGGTTPTVSLECVDCGAAPLAVAPLSVHEFVFSVFQVDLQDHAGLNASTPTGTLSVGGSLAANTQTILNTNNLLDEITHTAPKEQVGGVTQFSFLWTAPAANGPVTITAWGNAVNFNGNLAGDAAASTTLDIDVGTGAPTPTDTPAAGTPTPTATPGGSGCPTTVDMGCETGFAKGLLLVKESVPGREKLVAKLIKGPALAQTDMGNPLDAGLGGTGTAYSLCVYDIFADLAGALTVDRAGNVCSGKPCWKAIGKAPNDPQGPGKGYKYKDDALASDGVLKILYKGGGAGKSKALLVAKGANLPHGIPAALQTSSQVTLQLRSSDGACLSVDLGEIKKQDPLFFKAK